MESLKKIKWANVVISLFLIGIGVCIFVWTGITTSTLCVAIGVAALIFGILKLVSYFVRDVKGVAVNYDFSIGALCVIFGVIMLIHPQNVVELLQILIGVYLLLDSVFKLQTSMDSKRIGVPGWWVTLIFTLACLILGFMLIFKVNQNMLMYLIAVALIADGLQNLCMVIFAAVAGRAIENAAKEAAAAAGAAAAAVAITPAMDRPQPEAASEPIPALPAEPEPVTIHIAAASEDAVPAPADSADIAAPASTEGETEEKNNEGSDLE